MTPTSASTTTSSFMRATGRWRFTATRSRCSRRRTFTPPRWSAIAIYVIGSLGYQGTRRYGETPVYRLNVHTLRMERLDASGESPGWIYKHRAVAEGVNEIRVWGGMVVTGSDNTESHDQNLGFFVLELDRLRWRCETKPECE